MSKSISEYFKEIKQLVDQELSNYFSLLPEKVPPVIVEAMRYSLFAGGKRLRPVLLIASAEAVGGERGKVLPFAAALELIHTYTLIHDDLPALDNDDYRRGKLSNHKQFGEALAILAGDGLLTFAFEIMTNPSLNKDIPALDLLTVIHEIAREVGVTGTIGGQVVDIQVVDLQSKGEKIETSTLEYIHKHKTAALITAALRAGACLAGATEEELKSLTEYGKNIGLAFQVVDDILDLEGERELLGKDIHSDLKSEKVTYPALLGLPESKKIARELTEKAISCLKNLGGGGDILREIAYYIIERRC